jgi:hypothetical protein
MIAMKNLKSSEASTEVKCSACNGTGFPAVAQRAPARAQDLSTALQAVFWQGPNGDDD